jgi:hypothetical protein
MIVEEMFALYNPWIYLQQPTHPTAGMNASYRGLLAAIDQGWEIIEPVLISDESRAETKTYHFTLMHAALGQTYHLSVSGSSELEHLIHIR